MIEIRLKKRQGVFDLDIELCLPFDGICGLIGPSGSGKSSLFSMLAGHATPDAGLIRVDDRTLYCSETGFNVPPARRGIGLVFQDGLLFPHMSVARNLAYGTRGKKPRHYIEVIEALNLGHLLDRKPGRLSGGERQRVAIGRALLAEPRLLLLDEPVSALDPGLREEVMSLIEKLHARTGTPMIYISHAPEEIRRLATRVVTLKDGAVADMSRHPCPHSRGHDTPEPSRLRAI